MTHEVLHSGLARLVDALEELEDEVCVTVDDRDADVVVILVLQQQGRCALRLIASRATRVGLTEYEFSPSTDEPVARMLGE